MTDPESQEEGVGRLFLNELNQSAGVRSCGKHSVGTLEAVSRELPAAEGLGELPPTKNMNVLKSISGAPHPYGTVKFPKNSSHTNLFLQYLTLSTM